MSKLFISHAARDKLLVDKFVDLITSGLGLSFADIFCSSLPGMDPPAGEDFVDYIKSRVAEADMMIFILSRNFFDSAFCLCELGAAWVMDKSKFPILVPPLDYKDAKAVLVKLQNEKLDNRDSLNKLKEQIQQEFTLTVKGVSRWEDKRNIFLDGLHETIQSLPQPEHYSKVEYDEQKDLVDAYRRELEDVREVTIQKDSIISDLKNCKDAREVRHVIIEHSNEWEQFEELVSSANSSLQQIPAIARRAMFHEPNGGFDIDPLQERDYWSQALEAESRRFVDIDRNFVTVRKIHPKIIDCTNNLRQLRSFLGTVGEEFYTSHYDKYDVEPDLDNIDFWELHFDMR